jgi:hypothetical protein
MHINISFFSFLKMYVWCTCLLIFSPVLLASVPLNQPSSPWFFDEAWIRTQLQNHHPLWRYLKAQKIQRDATSTQFREQSLVSLHANAQTWLGEWNYGAGVTLDFSSLIQRIHSEASLGYHQVYSEQILQTMIQQWILEIQHTAVEVASAHTQQQIDKELLVSNTLLEELFQRLYNAGNVSKLALLEMQSQQQLSQIQFMQSQHNTEQKILQLSKLLALDVEHLHSQKRILSLNDISFPIQDSIKQSETLLFEKTTLKRRLVLEQQQHAETLQRLIPSLQFGIHYDNEHGEAWWGPSLTIALPPVFLGAWSSPLHKEIEALDSFADVEKMEWKYASSDVSSRCRYLLKQVEDIEVRQKTLRELQKEAQAHTNAMFIDTPALLRIHQSTLENDHLWLRYKSEWAHCFIEQTALSKGILKNKFSSTTNEMRPQQSKTSNSHQEGGH